MNSLTATPLVTVVLATYNQQDFVKNALESIKLKKSSLETHNLALVSLSKLLKMKKEINRIEAYDNSHTSGKNSVGVMVVADKEGLSPKNYRKFKDSI